jgi:hypothetical protein
VWRIEGRGRRIYVTRWEKAWKAERIGARAPCFLIQAYR